MTYSKPLSIFDEIKVIAIFVFVQTSVHIQQ